VVDSWSTEVNRRAKTDRLDADKLPAFLLRHPRGERRVWSVVHELTAQEADARRTHREIACRRRPPSPRPEHHHERPPIGPCVPLSSTAESSSKPTFHFGRERKGGAREEGSPWLTFDDSHLRQGPRQVKLSYDLGERSRIVQHRPGLGCAVRDNEWRS
jgi:hypothetical protein